VLSFITCKPCRFCGKGYLPTNEVTIRSGPNYAHRSCLSRSVSVTKTKTKTRVTKSYLHWCAVQDCKREYIAEERSLSYPCEAQFELFEGMVEECW
jgi:hypothetical protein